MNQIIESDLEEIYNSGIDWKRLDGRVVMLTGPYGMLASYVTLFLIYLNREKNIDVKLVAVGRDKAKFNSRIGAYYGPDDWTRSVSFLTNDLSAQIQYDGQVDYIIHAASLASPQYYDVCPVDVLKPNVIGTYNLLEYAAKRKIEGFLLFSTGDVYGAVDGNLLSVNEDSYGVMNPLDIHNCYSESKRMAETMCKAYSVQYGVPVRIARIWHTYSPTMDIEHDPRVFASFVKNIVHSEDIVMKSGGRGRRAFCYITDAVAGYFRILLDGTDAEAYNVCNSEAYVSVAELAETLVGLSPEKQLKVVRVNRSADEHYVENVLLKDRYAVPCADKLKSLGWKPKVSLEEGFGRVIKYLDEA